MADLAADVVTRDAFFGGRLTLDQLAKGHRSGTDAVLLAAGVPRNFAGTAFDMGAGVGAAGLGIALACPAARIRLVERDEVLLALARQNVVANGFDGRVDVVACNLLSRSERALRLPAQADLVVTNPPFHREGSVRPSPDPRRRAAHVMEPGFGLGDWLGACLDRLAPKGVLMVVHHVAALPEMLLLLTAGLGAITLIPVQAHVGDPAIRVLLRGTKGSRAPLRIAPPLVLHRRDLAGRDTFTPEAAALHAGTATLDW